MKVQQLLFIAGIPAAGKSHFGNWLEAQHGFVHIDPEENDILDSLGMYALWDSCVASYDCTAFVRRLQRLGRPIVFNWGFPVGYLPVVAGLKRAGFTCWWLDADVAQARAEFLRMGKSLECFDRQVAAIEAARGQILGLFEPNVVTTLNQAGMRLPPEAIWAAVQRAPVRRGEPGIGSGLF